MNQQKFGFRLTAYFLSLIVFLGTFTSFIDVAHAGTTVGASGSINATGSKTGINGGISHIEKVSFRVGISRDPDLHNPMDNVNLEARKAFSHRFPKNDESFFFIPAGQSSLYSNPRVAQYNAGTRKLDYYTDSLSLSRLVHLQSAGGAPYNKGKSTALNGWSVSGNANYAKLVKSGEWTQKANMVTREDAIAVWSYILAPTGGGSTSSYDIQNRIDAFISPHAKKKESDMTDAEKEDVARGYLGLLFTLRALSSTNASMRTPWDQAIKDYMLQADLGSEQKPVTVLIDTAITVSVAGTYRTVLSSVDYFQYYTAVNQNNNIYTTTNLGSGAGDTYSMLDRIVNQTISEDKKSVGRTSDHYDAGNPFAFGASAIAYPGKRYSTSAITSGAWKSGSYAAGYIDVLTFGRSASGSGTIRGFLAVGSDLKFTPSDPGGGIPDEEIPPPDPKADVNFQVLPEYKRPYLVSRDSEVIGTPTELQITHNPESKTAIAAWETVLKGNWQMVNTKITWTRNPNVVNPVAPNKGHLDGYALDSVWFLDWLRGKNKILIHDTATVSEPIEAGAEKQFKYIPTVTFTYKYQGKTKTFTVKPNYDIAKFKREPKPPDIDPIMYTSSPTTFAEIKDNSPDNEQWDAMAGVPSNKRLYLGVGGSEFIVDVELEYKQDVESVWRTYRSYFTGTPSEFKIGDTPTPNTIGGQTVNLHDGGTYTKTWSGSIPNNGTASTVNGTGTATATSVAVPDMSDYNAKKAEAAAYIAQVNATTHTWTAASDKVTRTKTGWNARITTDAPNPPQNVTDTKTNYATEGDPPRQVGKPVTATANPAPAGSYTITVTFDVPAHYLDGPDSENDMPGVEDTWKQRINFDYMKISKVEVYKITEGRIENVDSLLGQDKDTLKATIRQGDPNIFYNIAQQNAGGNDVTAQSSVNGRLRYSLNWDQHDTVVYAEGTRSNKSDGMGNNGSTNSPTNGGHANFWATGILYNNTGYTTELDYHRDRGGVKSGYTNLADTKDVGTMEWKKFDERRKAMNTATVISDMLILQTSSGNQSVIYFEKDSTPKQAQEQFDPVVATKEEMWDNNTNSAAKWTKDRINIGSYNGEYAKTGTGAGNNQKYWGLQKETKALTPSNTARVTTKFDSNGAGVRASRVRPAMPSRLYVWGSEAIVPTTPNGLYRTGISDVFYTQILKWTSPNAYEGTYGKLSDPIYTPTSQSKYNGRSGLVYEAPYSERHEKVNDVVIHTPVSTQEAMVISLPDSRDQRTETPAGGAAAMIDENNRNKVPINTGNEYNDSDDPLYKDEVLAEFDFERTTSNTIYNRTRGIDIPYAATTGFTFSPVTGFGNGNVLNAKGTRMSFDFSDLGLLSNSATTVLVEFDFLLKEIPKTGMMLISFGMYDLYIPANQEYGFFNTGNGTGKRIDGVSLVGRPMRLGLQFSFDKVADSKAFINGVEHKLYTDVAPAGDLAGKLGTKLNIGSWTYDNNYPADFLIDNMKITRKGQRPKQNDPPYVFDGSGVYNKYEHNADSFNLALLPQDVASDPAPSVTTWDFAYKGSYELFTAPATGSYMLEAWGASGGNGASGGYAKGTVSLSKDDRLYIYTGGAGQTGYSGSVLAGGFNGGGSAMSAYSDGNNGSGGGATDFRTSTTLASRLLVAGGGGGGVSPITQFGEGGGLTGGTGTFGGSFSATGGTQSGGGTGNYSNGSLGVGASGTRAGGGGGYYGGGASYSGSTSGGAVGGGGSSYVGGVQNGTTTQGGNTGNGKAKVTYLNSTSNASDGDSWDFTYKGSVEPFVVPVDGTYLLETWGAEGGTSGYGGKGGYAKGEIELTKGQTLNVSVGGQTGWNGGGSGHGRATDSGGGKTDITPVGEDYLIVAGGGGGWGSRSNIVGGDGGGLTGAKGGDGSSNRQGGNGGGQSQSSNGGSGVTSGGSGTKGQGGSNNSGSNSGGGGGGGGYFGGGAGGSDYPNYDDLDDGAGGGGSSYIAKLQKASTTAGGNSGNGKAKITLVSGSSSSGLSETGYAGYTWEQLLGANWRNYVTVTNTGGGGVAGQVIDFNYKGSKDTYVVPSDGVYRLEAFGAGGGGADPGSGGKGGYIKGEFTFKKGDVISIYVGQGGRYGQGILSSNMPSFNGGGSGHGYGGAGGGATDFRKNGDTLSSRILVAGGGGGGSDNIWSVSHGGGLTGATSGQAGGGTQTSGGAGHGNGTSGSLGQGGTAGDYNNAGGGGGGGYYGGGAGSGDNSSGGGGSSWASSQATAVVTTAGGGANGGTSQNGGSNTSAGNLRDGYSGSAKITVVSVNNKKVELNEAAIKANIKSIPERTPDGGTNPLFTSMLPIGGSTSVGAIAGGTLTGAEIVPVQHRTSGVTFNALVLRAGQVNPSAFSQVLNLAPNKKYVIEFDYFADRADSRINFGVTTGTSSLLPKSSVLANTSVQKAKFNFNSSSATIKDAKLFFSNNATPRNEGNIYIMGIRIYEEPAFNTHEPTDEDDKLKDKDWSAPPINNDWEDRANDTVPVYDSPTTTTPTGETFTRGTFINLDYPFEVYFPNLGDFMQRPDMRGISAVTSTRGYGYNNSMDTTQYTQKKQIRFQFNVMYNNTVYPSGTWIQLPVAQSRFDFYAPLGNKEALAASIEYEAIPINASPIGDPVNENYVATTNKERFPNYYSYHGAYKMSYIDIVGRIGNFVVSDTEDFRFSNLFKQEDGTGNWIVEGLVKTVDSDRQRAYYGDLFDIRGTAVATNPFRLNTYGTQPWLNNSPLQFPVNPKDNVVESLKKQPIKIGYEVLGDISTIGDYRDGVVRVLPYYYKLNLDTGSVTPLDAYTKEGVDYKPVNLYRQADGGALPTGLYEHPLVIDWFKEAQRRNFTLDEATITDRVSESLGELVLADMVIDGEVEQGVTGVKRLTTPSGNYVDIGNAQRLVLDKKARTFIGSTQTNGVSYDGNGVIPRLEFEQQAQRWHMKFGLPSSTVFVESGKTPTKENLDATQSGNSVVLLTADIISIGSVYTLRWDQPGVSSFSVTKDNASRTFNIRNSGIPPVIAIYDLSETSQIDVTVKGNH